MSKSYAAGLSDYENKGKCGLPEWEESVSTVEEKVKVLAIWLKESKHIIVHTGAGVSTASGIPDFRGPNGVWTLEKQGRNPDMNVSFDDAKPTFTHMALCALESHGYLKGKLRDIILDWEDNLPERDLWMADHHSKLADLSLCLGTTLQIVPAGTLPLMCKKNGGKLVVVNLQQTKHHKKADMVIRAKVDHVMMLLLNYLNLPVKTYDGPKIVEFSTNGVPQMPALLQKSCRKRRKNNQLQRKEEKPVKNMEFAGTFEEKREQKATKIVIFPDIKQESTTLNVGTEQFHTGNNSLSIDQKTTSVSIK